MAFLIDFWKVHTCHCNMPIRFSFFDNFQNFFRTWHKPVKKWYIKMVHFVKQKVHKYEIKVKGKANLM